MLRENCPAGMPIWFRDGAFLRRGYVVAAVGPQVCLRSGMQLLERVRKDVWESEAAALRSQVEQLSEQLALLEAARGRALARLAELAGRGSTIVATVRYPDGRVEHVGCCECPDCAAKVCQS